MRSSETTWCQATAALASRYKVVARLKKLLGDAPSDWGWLIAPVPDHLEPEHLGPVPGAEIEWVELDMTRNVHRGRLVPDARIDVSAELLGSLGGFRFVVEAAANIVRIYPDAE